MAMSILDMVLSRLRRAGFKTGVAYPGQKYPPITEPMATVHIEKVDRNDLTVTVGVDILCPAAMGGTACELEALRATEVLRQSRAVCIQNGCTYDGVAQVYAVSILATYTGVTEADHYTLWSGFWCTINIAAQLHVIRFRTEEETGYQAEYAAGEETPAGFSRGSRIWRIEMEEMIPTGYEEKESPDADFTLQVTTDTQRENYYHCQWTSITREYTRQGLHRVRKGFALDREVESIEHDAL